MIVLSFYLSQIGYTVFTFFYLCNHFYFTTISVGYCNYGPISSLPSWRVWSRIPRNCTRDGMRSLAVVELPLDTPLACSISRARFQYTEFVLRIEETSWKCSIIVPSVFAIALVARPLAVFHPFASCAFAICWPAPPRVHSRGVLVYIYIYILRPFFSIQHRKYRVAKTLFQPSYDSVRQTCSNRGDTCRLLWVHPAQNEQ